MSRTAALAGLAALAVLVWPSSAPAEGRVELLDGIRVVTLTGRPYELGWQHGALLREEVRGAVGQVLGSVRRYLKVPILRSWLGSWWLDRAWRPAWRHIPKAYLEELRGLAEGSGVPYLELLRMHAVPDRTYACANFAAWGRATGGGRLIHARNLDWNIDVGLQRYAVVFVVRPEDGRAFVSAGWAGFIGVLTGVNEDRVSIGQIGAETVERTYDGVPMAFLMRRVLEQAGTLEEAVRILEESPRTVGVNYIVADAKEPGAVAVETTARHCRVFEADDPAEHEVAYARPLADAVVRADTAMDPEIRDRQLASKGDPGRPGFEPPAGSAYETRYLGQVRGIRDAAGALDVAGALAIAQAVAPESNIQSTIIAWPEFWVANADGRVRAAHTDYHRLDLPSLFEED
ncbi:MAG TPA: C45 family peptidase [bacterium]